jgi:hypothetical protein
MRARPPARGLAPYPRPHTNAAASHGTLTGTVDRAGVDTTTLRSRSIPACQAAQKEQRRATENKATMHSFLKANTKQKSPELTVA